MCVAGGEEEVSDRAGGRVSEAVRSVGMGPAGRAWAGSKQEKLRGSGALPFDFS